MKIVALVAVSLAACLALGEVADAKRSPRLEKLALRPADGKQAQKGLVRLSDLVSGWKGGPVNRSHNAAPDCGLNFSAFTLTGRAEAAFSQTGAQLQSGVQVFATRAQALGDFTVDTRPGSAKCEGETFAKAVGSSAELVSAKKVAAPKVGEHAAAFRWVIRLGVNLIYVDVIEFVRDRTVGGVFAANVGSALRGINALARLMDVRLQSNVA